MNRQEQVAALVWLLVGLFIIIYALRALRVGTTRAPGPGFFPLVAGISLAFFSLIVLLKETFGKISGKGTKGELRNDLNRRGIVYVTIALLVYAVLLETVGFLVMTTVLLIYLFRAIVPQKWGFAVGLSILAVGVSYLIFDRLLQLQLPRGFLGL